MGLVRLIQNQATKLSTSVQKALQNSNYKHTLIYKHPDNDNNNANINNAKRNRKQQIIWFNPPFNLNTKR